MKNLLFVGAIFILTASSCSLFKKSSNQDQVVEQILPVHNSRNSLDWSGTYRGIVPCADCPGIKTEITLYNDLKYIFSRQYLGESDSVYVEKGSFSWNEAGSEITLNKGGSESDTKHFFVGENMLIMLDASGNKINGDLAENYKLTRLSAGVSITNKYWKLIELGGKEIRNPDVREKEAHVILADDESRAYGNTGCNFFNGNYELINHKLISFSPLASTRMYCHDVEHEGDFLMMFERAKSYKNVEDTLHLFDAEENLLGVFVWDFFKPTKVNF